jgi:gas vesicle protein
MKEEGLTNERSILVPFLVGGIVGAGIALLLAPKSGKEIRGQIRNFALDTKDTVASTFNKGKELYDEGRVAVMNAIEAGKEAYVQEREKHVKAA